MALLGQVVASTHCTQLQQNVTDDPDKQIKRNRNSVIFYHQGKKNCRKIFLFLHTIVEFRLKALKAHYLSQGLFPRTHGHCGRIAPNALVLEDIKCIITFIMHYTEVNGILLPGRIPGYKRDDIQLLPSSTTKRAVWKLYQDSSTTSSARTVSYSIFCKVWKNFLGRVVISKPMTDLCAVCQKNLVAILRSVNLSEDEKTEVNT